MLPDPPSPASSPRPPGAPGVAGTPGPLPPPLAAPAPSSPAGWYTDPRGAASLRWWDGRAWTEHTHPLSTPEPAPDPTLPLRAGLWGLGFVVVAVFVTRFLVPLLADTGLPVVLLLLCVVVLFYAPMVLWCAFASRRFGTGHLRDDLGLRFRAVDFGWGLAALAAAWACQVGVALALTVLRVPIGSNTDAIASGDLKRSVELTLAAAAVIAAPFVEELFFRGLLLRSLRSRLAPLWANTAQALIFGVFHFDVSIGVGVIGLMLVLAAVGFGFGLIAQRVGRIGPTILAHALFNGIVFVVLLTR